MACHGDKDFGSSSPESCSVWHKSSWRRSPLAPLQSLRYADDTTLSAEVEEELKSLLTKVIEESEKVGLKLKIQKTKIMASGSIVSWQIDGEIIEIVRDFIFLGSIITADGDFNHKIKTLASCKKCCDQTRQHIEKQSYYFADKGASIQSSDFSSSHIRISKLYYKEN